MTFTDDPPIKRADAALVETAQLWDAHQGFRAEVGHQVERMKQIEAELDPLLPHPPEELGRLRALAMRNLPEERQRWPARTGRWPPG